MTKAQERINKLLSDIGINLEDEGYSSAEVDGYCAGIKLVADKIDKIISYIFINLDDNDDLSYYKMFVKSADSKQRIIDRLGEGYGSYRMEDLIYWLEMLGPSFTNIDEDGITFDNVQPQYFSMLGAVSSWGFPPYIKVKYAGSGKSFDEWDLWSKSWIELDKMGLPFNIIDTLRGNE